MGEAELKPPDEQYGVASTPCHFFSLIGKTGERFSGAVQSMRSVSQKIWKTLEAE